MIKYFFPSLTAKKAGLFSLGFFALAIFFPLAIFNRAEALADSVLHFDLASKTVEINQAFSVDAMVDPGTNQATDVELYITFDPAKLRLDDVTVFTSAFPVILQSAVINNISGTASIILGVPRTDPLVPVVSDSIMATLEFYSLAVVQNSSVAYSTDSMVAALGETTSVVASREPILVTITNTAGFQADFDSDGDVDIFDYNILIGHFGTTGDCGNQADTDADCDVDIFDYSVLMGEFGSGT